MALDVMVSDFDSVENTTAVEADTPALELRGVTKRFGDTIAVNNLDVVLPAGDFLTLLGPSGSGKSTILKLIAGFTQPSAGKIFVHGRDVSRLPPGKRDIGVVFQNYALFPHLSVERNVAYPLKMRHWSKADIADRVEEMLALTGLADLSGRRPHELSGGQQQRVALARALAPHPSFLLMDEPLAALDRSLRRDMQSEIRRIHRATGVTILFVTHDQDEALTMSSRIGVLRSGALVQIGDTAEIFARPATSFIVSLLGECNLWPAETLAFDNGRVRVKLANWEFQLPHHGDGTPSSGMVMLRPTRMRLAKAGSDEFVLDAVVDDIQFLGENVRVAANAHGLGKLVASLDARSVNGLQAGSRLALAFSPDDLGFVVDDTTKPTRAD